MQHIYQQILLTNILRLIAEQGITKKELAERAGMSISFLSDLTNDKANPSLKIMEAIADALDTPLPALLVTDLDEATLKALTGSKTVQAMPPGLERVTALLTEFQAFQVKRWDAENRQSVAKRQKD